MLLDPGTGPVRAATYLPSTPENVLWGRLPCAADVPVLTVDPGTEVTVDTLSHEGLLEDQGRDPRAYFGAHGLTDVLADAVALAGSAHPHDPAHDGPHVVTGPVAVRGARPGDVLAITVLETLPRVPYGVISNRHGRGALPGEMPEGGADVVSVLARLDATGTRAVMPRAAGSLRTVSFPVAPFPGILGVAVAGDQRPHSVPPGAHGGNLDINLLQAGATLYLPVQVDDALAYVGDPHFAQGDGEVALTALEASLRVTLRFDLLPRAQAVDLFGPLAGPLVRTAEHLVPTGLDVDLDEALRRCVRAALDLLQARFGMDRAHALAYLSAATDFDVSQVVDRVTGVHARIRLADLEESGEPGAVAGPAAAGGGA